MAATSLVLTLVTVGGDATAAETTAASAEGSCPSDCELKDQVLTVPLLGETEKMTLVK